MVSMSDALDEVVIPARSEIDVAADTVWALMEAGLIERTPLGVRRAAAAVQISVDDIRAAAERRGAGRYQPPREHAKRQDVWPQESVRRWEAGSRRGSEAAAERKSKQPKAGETSMVCRKCGNQKDVEEFPPRPDRPGKRRTICGECKREAARDRYLDLQKVKAMNAAHITFMVSEDDAALDLCCIDCGAALRPGDHVEGNVQLRHVNCPEAP